MLHTTVTDVDLPFSEAADRNKGAILDVLREHLSNARDVLEVGSGTGQHAAYFAGALPHLNWQASERAENLATLSARLAKARLENASQPIEFDIGAQWPTRSFDAVFSANTLHIMPWAAVAKLFKGTSALIRPGGKMLVYGPFNYRGQFTSESNQQFDRMLRENVPHQGIRDFEAVDALARDAGLTLLGDRPMPANNRCVIWQLAP